MSNLNLNRPCPFCAALMNQKETCEYYRRPGDTSVSEYTVALVHRRYYNDYPSGQTTHYGFKLNFCPVCGKEILEATYEDKESDT